ncbi:hypothetical protein CTEN210_04228 [Chaetoceros tenuissimus]|uniref:SLC41A/MgtE integral membrane domain-containing protein n=1 Tax=Chaetoceros tenuissimus TaxID=426638 RepID=A0AAD3CKT7_9STRA|nr:hypothetical protein CTEN210_04228 [Chaetoceros tenuissimus]
MAHQRKHTTASTASPYKPIATSSPTSQRETHYKKNNSNLALQASPHPHPQRTRKRDRVQQTFSSILTKLSFSKENDTCSTDIEKLQQENLLLKQTIEYLESQNAQLSQSHQKQRIILEQFEGEGRQVYDQDGNLIENDWWDQDSPSTTGLRQRKTYDEESQSFSQGSSVSHTSSLTQEHVPLTSKPSKDMDTESCQEFDENACPIEPDISFKDALKDRAYWLVGLLTLQSMSGFILARNEDLLQTHPVIVYFLTMLVGAGGNAGNQAAVRVIRGIALGTLNERTQKQFLNREFKMAVSLSVILSLAGFIRATAFGTPFPETVAVTSALAIIVFTSICFGAVLPLILRKIDVDPAHSSTTIQVIMDILGVVLTVFVSTTLLDSPLGKLIIGKLTGAE